MMLKAVVLVLSVLVSGSSQQCFSSNDSAAVVDHFLIRPLTENRLRFSLKLFHILNEYDNVGNVIFSPSSIYDFLQLAYFGAAGDTEASLHEVLANEYLKKSQIWRVFRTQSLITSDQEVSNYPLKTANKLFFSNKLKVRPCVVENLKNNVELMDFQNEVGTSETYINKWVEDVTQGEVKEFLKTLTSSTTVAPVNAVYFKAEWGDDFSPVVWNNIPFHVNSKITKMTTMLFELAELPIAHIQEINARVVKLLTRGGRQAMFVILPNDDLNTTIQALTVKFMEDIISGVGSEEKFMELMIPKFKDSNEVQLNHALEELGLGYALSPDADYSRFTGRKEVTFDTVKQKATIEVDKEGAKAADASGTETGRRGIAIELFTCDHPFAYFIYDFLTDTILFMGTFRHPN